MGSSSAIRFGPNVELLAAKNQVIGVDLQSHGRSPAADRPIRFEATDDIGALIRSLDLEQRRSHGLLPRWRRRFGSRTGCRHHYDINVAPLLSAVANPFLEGT
jgi:pimeloyl-ACP methyl ester carboxylesterase